MTIKDLAAQTGYAVGTVSRVLNNHPNVSEKARKGFSAERQRKAAEANPYDLCAGHRQGYLQRTV